MIVKKPKKFRKFSDVQNIWKTNSFVGQFEVDGVGFRIHIVHSMPYRWDWIVRVTSMVVPWAFSPVEIKSLSSKTDGNEPGADEAKRQALYAAERLLTEWRSKRRQSKKNGKGSG